MKSKRFSYILIISVILFSLTTKNHAQGWEWQNPKPQGNILSSVQHLNEQTIFIAVWGGGSILKTKDNGNNWELIPLPERIFANDVFFINENVGWTCGQSENGAKNKVYGTKDGGKNWELQINDEFGIFNSIVFVNENKGWISGKSARIFHTIDGGETWTLQADFPGNITSFSLIDSSHIWAANPGIVDGALLYTNDGGENWLVDSTITWGKDVCFIDSLNGWVSGVDKIARTTDGGNTWQIQLDMLDLFPVEWNEIFMVDKNNGWAITTFQTQMASTTDGGNNWTIKANPADYDLEGLSFIDSLNGIAVGLWGTIIKTSDGGNNWQNLTERVTFKRLRDLHFKNENRGWIVGKDGTILKTTNKGNDWSVQQVEADLWGVFFIDSLNGWVCGEAGKILRTTDGGEVWNPIPNPYNFTLRSIDFTNYPVGFIAGDSSLSNARIIKTTDGGDSWKETLSANFSPGEPQIQFTSPDIGWLMVGSLMTGGIQSLYKTIDEGENWTQIKGNYTDTAYTSMQFISNSTGWVSTFRSNIIFYTNDGGESWQRFLTPESFSSISFIDSIAGWAAGRGEIHYTSDRGETWSPTHSFTNSADKILFINKNFGWAIGSLGFILHTSTGGVTSIKDFVDNEKFPDNFTLYQNYPNPFNPTTTISYTLPFESSITLEIYDITGRLIQKYESQNEQAGYHNYVWNGKNNNSFDVASGVYIYRFIAVSLKNKEVFSKSDKMLLLR